MPFFDQPGYSAGPYSTPAREGMFTKILQGVNVAMKLGDFYQNWQAKSQAQKTGALQGLASQIGLAKAINPEGTITPTQEMIEQGKKGGFDWPTVTEEGKTGMAAKLLPAPVASTPGNMVTSPTDPAQIARDVVQQQGMANLPAVGSPMPIAPTRPSTLEAAMIKNLPPGTDYTSLWKAAHAKNATQYGVYDPATKTMQSTGNVRPTVLHPKETFEEWTAKQGIKDANAKDRIRYANEVADTSPRNQNYQVGPTGIPEPMGVGKFRNIPTDKGAVQDQAVITPEQALQQGSIKKGTRIVTPEDPIKKNIRGAMEGTAPPKPAGKEIIDSGGGPPPTALKEGHVTTFKNGQQWQLVNGIATKVK
jgi:hypothetical protein